MEVDIDQTSSTVRSFSPDIFASFSEDDKSTQDGKNEAEDEEMPLVMEKEKKSNRTLTKHWKGTSLEELRQSFGRWGPPPFPSIHSSENHTVLFKLPVKQDRIPEPFRTAPQDKWDQDHVRMPHSSESLYPVQETEDEKGLRLRWELVQEALLRGIVSSHQLEAAILSYNSRYNEKWNFVALHSFFNHVLDEEETEHFFRDVLPRLVRLALQLPDLINTPLPLLRKHQSHTISISQLQVASLLANAFFCTFPRRNSTKRGSEYSAYPDINFNRLFQCGNTDDSSPVTEKLKCIVSYFRRVSNSAPQGVLTFSRRYMQPSSLPSWSKSRRLMPKLYISSDGFIEDEGSGMLQVDFANKFVGGGILGWGCVQEEIRFAICPELLASRLFTECLDSTEVLLIVGCERFSNYSGYGATFQWKGDHHDETPLDSTGRRHCSIVAMDALFFNNSSSQYTLPNITREINKAYGGFSEPESSANLAAVATGNWGCGAFRGDPHLKALLQLMAAGEAGRSVAYFTFGDEGLRDRIFRMYRFLVDNGVCVGHLWTLLCQYSRLMSSANNDSRPDLYKYLYATILEPGCSKEPRTSPSVRNFFPTKATKGETKESNKFASSSRAGKSIDKNLAQNGISAEDLDALIEEFDSDPEMNLARDKEPLEEEQMPNRVVRKQAMNEEIQRKDQDKDKDRKFVKEERGKQDQGIRQEFEQFREGQARAEHSEQNPKIKKSKEALQTPSSSRKAVSCLSLIEEGLGNQSTVKNVVTRPSKILSGESMSPVTSCTHDNASPSSPSLLQFHFPMVETLSESSFTDSTTNISSSSSANKMDSRSDPKAQITIESSTQESRHRVSGTKRKISDYFSTVKS